MTACLDIFDVNICVYNFPSTLSNILIEDKLCFSYTQVQPTIADDGLKSVGTRISGMTPQATQTYSPIPDRCWYRNFDAGACHRKH